MQDRVIEFKSSFFLVRPAKLDDYMPLACPVCDTLMCLDDSHTWTRFKCCTRCANEWAYTKQTEWDSGWRPGAEEIRIHLSVRPGMRVNVNAL